MSLIGNTWHGIKQSYAWPIYTTRWLHFLTLSLDATSCLTKTNQLLNFSTFLVKQIFVRHNLVCNVYCSYYIRMFGMMSKPLYSVSKRCGRGMFLGHFLLDILLDFNLKQKMQVYFSPICIFPQFFVVKIDSHESSFRYSLS